MHVIYCHLKRYCILESRNPLKFRWILSSISLGASLWYVISYCITYQKAQPNPAEINCIECARDGIFTRLSSDSGVNNSKDYCATSEAEQESFFSVHINNLLSTTNLTINPTMPAVKHTTARTGLGSRYVVRNLSVDAMVKTIECLIIWWFEHNWVHFGRFMGVWKYLFIRRQFSCYAWLKWCIHSVGIFQ